MGLPAVVKRLLAANRQEIGVAEILDAFNSRFSAQHQITYSACRCRLSRMAKRGLFTLANGMISPAVERKA